ncbi:hypothetical protein Poli38472_001238 [Pythium oligandrum]|uniref:MARVEL domain-containing protein n=1 Tax=Pythium oligandrum TaxID=41045 RepID=A0A8K1CSI7_PYTOL|nr:hypothetical protein Poli38472_001238 [Pythium oligandrum]|eukprot:TMW69082.1 hypothetical protein Poli38472_001238 [Pythium oligandrum]
MKLSSATIKLINLALRGAQLVLSVVAMATVAAAFENNDAYPTSYRLGSHNTNFLLLMTYSSFMYSLWYIACVELGGLATRPRKLLSRAMDTVLAVFLLSAAIAVAASDYVTKCDSYDLLIRCDTLTSAVTVTCLSVMPLVGSFGLTYVESSTDEELDMTPTVYEQQSTPKAGGAYGQMPPTPSTKV